MDAIFQDIAGIITDGSGPLDGEGLGRVIAAGARGAALRLGSGGEFAIAGLTHAPEADETINGAPDSFFLASASAAGPFDQWRSTGSVSQFGEAGRGTWAAVRAFPDSQKFWLARDQFGQQPLYYAEKGPMTAFSTDLNWFFESDFLKPTFNEDCFGELIQLQFLAGGQTAFDGVRRVFPGETLVIERGRVVDHLRRPAVPLSDRSFADRAVALGALDAVLDDAVDRALNEVRLPGCVLTGDLASTALAIAIARRTKRRVRAYLPCIKEDAEDAPELLAGLAKGLGLDPVPLPLDAGKFFGALPTVARAMAEPVGDHGAVAWQLIADAAKADGATLLLPSGGQELFGAYGRYRTAARPLWLGGRAMRARGHLQGLAGLTEGPSHWRDGLTGVESRLRGSRFSGVQRLQLVDISTWLPNDTLLGEQQIIARAGVDVRRPYLDPDLASFAFSLSDHLKLRGQEGGILLRDWIGKTFPSAAPALRSVRTAPPLGPWIAARSGTLGSLVDSTLAAAGFVAEGSAVRIFKQVARKKSKRLGMAAWQLLYFALWYEAHISDRGVGPVAAALTHNT